MRSLIFMAVLMAVFIAFLYIVLAKASTGKQEIREERVMTPTYTPVPAPEQWVRYSVPLDDDLQKYIEKLCREKEIPSSIVVAVIGVETGGTFDPELKGDYIDGVPRSFGLMQIYASEHTKRCKELNAINLLDPYKNVRVGIDILAELIGPDWFNGDWNGALSYYNHDSTGRYAERVQAYAECLAESVLTFTE
jgi:soluble lytic murein transglycosylase-like protein